MAIDASATPDKLSSFEKQFLKSQKAAEASEAEERAKAEKREAALMKEMVGVATTGNVTSSNVANVVAAQSAEIAEVCRSG